MADAVVIVEASDHSGTLRTAAFALEQGKELYVVPGDITRPMSAGCNILLSNGASPYTDFDSFISNALRMRPRARKRRNLPPEERKIVEQIRQGEIDGEQIALNIGIDVSSFNQCITSLEIKGVVRALGCNRWALV